MLFSMTGYGDARHGGLSVEIRSVNNRHLKVTVRGSDPYPLLEADFEKAIRPLVKRGTLLVQVRTDRGAAVVSKLNTTLLKSYVAQITDELKGLNLADRASLLAGALALPGVAPEYLTGQTDATEEWPLVEATLLAALEKLNVARAVEGTAMATELRSLAGTIDKELAAVREHMPRIAGSYRQRMLDRVTLALSDAKLPVQPDHLIREVAIFADRIDVSEEQIRLLSHLLAFEEIIAGTTDSPGRRLEFVVQEMGREANTLGSKAGDVTISRHVIEIKAALEKMRELVQNVE